MKVPGWCTRLWGRRGAARMAPPLGRWPGTVPIVVFLHRDLPESHRFALRRAATWWRVAYGDALRVRDLTTIVEALAFAKGEPTPGTAFVAPDPTLRSCGATRVNVHDGVILSARVRLHPDLRGEQLSRCCLHQLGHVLGLADNPSAERSRLMCPDPEARGLALLPDEHEWLLAQWAPRRAWKFS